MNNLTNVFWFGKNGTIVQLDEILATKQDAPVVPPVDPDVIGGRKYKTARVGDQVWLAENLDLRWDGLIVGETPYSKKLDGLQQAAVYYNNDETTYGINGNRYGLLYNFAAVKYLNDHKDILIPGWHVPTTDELKQLSDFVTEDAKSENPSGFNTYYAGRRLYALEGWTYSATIGPPPLTSAPMDSYGFAAVPSGMNIGGAFRYDGTHCWLWSSSQTDDECGASAYMQSGFFVPYVFDSDAAVYRQYAVRLVKD